VRGVFISAFAAVVVAGLPSPVSAQQAQRTDPDASSPAGVIYEIPFDSARKDAAPKSARGSGSNASGNSGSSQGSSSGAAGAAGSGGGGSDGTGGSGGSGTGGAQGAGADANGGGGGAGGGSSSASADASNPNVGTSIHSENGFGSSSQVPGVAGATVQGDGPPSSALRAATAATDASPAGTYGLLAVVTLVGGWIGVAASRGLRV
jgi:hypothetical protein